MRIVKCVDCNALMEPKVEDSKWLVCHKCRLWFPREFVRRNHRDRDMKRVWELQPCSQASASRSSSPALALPGRFARRP